MEFLRPLFEKAFASFPSTNTPGFLVILICLIALVMLLSLSQVLQAWFKQYLTGRVLKAVTSFGFCPMVAFIFDRPLVGGVTLAAAAITLAVGFWRRQPCDLRGMSAVVVVLLAAGIYDDYIRDRRNDDITTIVVLSFDTHRSDAPPQEKSESWKMFSDTLRNALAPVATRITVKPERVSDPKDWEIKCAAAVARLEGRRIYPDILICSIINPDSASGYVSLAQKAFEIRDGTNRPFFNRARKGARADAKLHQLLQVYELMALLPATHSLNAAELEQVNRRLLDMYEDFLVAGTGQSEEILARVRVLQKASTLNADQMAEVLKAFESPDDARDAYASRNEANLNGALGKWTPGETAADGQEVR